jgi:sugar diacid utilization regulator
LGVTTKSTFGNKLSRGSCRERHCHKPWFVVNYRTAKRELRLWLKGNPNSHVAKHQESKLKNLLKRKKKFWEITRAQHTCVLTKVDALSF